MAENPAGGRTAKNVCIYWQTSETNPQLADGTGRCSATSVFSSSLISCYNEGQCNGYGTCRDCTAYDVGGLKFSHKNTNLFYGTDYLYVWDENQKKYLPTEKINETEAQPSSYSSRLPYSYEASISNFSGVQVPMNLAIYNLRAKFKRCCNWNGSPLIFSKDKNGTLYATSFSSGSALKFSYLYKSGSVYPNVLSHNKCVLAEALPWVQPSTTQNPTMYGCNGCKPECPYYTGPKWTYCIDDKMEHGDKISAAQIMELRYYSADWPNMPNPYDEWRKRFKDSVIWAWTGSFADELDTETHTEESLPTAKRVSVDSFDSIEPTISISPPMRVDEGVPVESISGGLFSDNTTNYPSLIRELNDVSGGMKIVWPPKKNSNPFTFRTFRIGQNNIYIFVDTPYPSQVYAVNVTKHQQGAMSDSDFIKFMQSDHEADLISAQSISGSGNVVVAAVELEFYPELNEIKVYARDPASSTGEYLTDSTVVRHKFYHAMVAQTEGRDNAGHKKLYPWVDRFEDVYIEADIMVLKGPLEADTILWDTMAGSKFTTYQTVEYITDEIQEEWSAIGCNTIAITFSNTKCNSVHPWEISGTYDSIPLGIYVDRSSNPKVREDGLQKVPLGVVFKSPSGQFIPANVIIAKPSITGLSIPAFDPNYDVVKATYRTSEVKQAPVLPEDKLTLRYPDYYNSYITEMPIEITTLSSSNFSVEGSFLGVTRGEGENLEKRRIYNLDRVKDELSFRLKAAENNAVYSFMNGGVSDEDISPSGEIYDVVKNNFETYYEGFVFSDGEPVTLDETCSRVQNISLHEGDYRISVIFKDETGRPIGVKRTYCLLQSAKVETRDVEIYYEWQMNLRPWYIYSSQSLLAVHSQPIFRGDIEGVETYRPYCGDHSEHLLQTHTQGSPGPMWYPYNRCQIPTYHEDHQNAEVKCSRYVEGFGEEYEGKRWAYWERMRGPDKLYTWIAGPIFLVGCFYRDISYSYSTEGEQNFSGYTRVRSAHPEGPFAKDREAIHLNRHYLKRNLKVRQEYVKRADEDFAVAWTDDFRQIAFSSSGNDLLWSELVGAESESPVWVHLVDDVCVVNRTTSDAQHPFTHYLMNSAGGVNYNEVFHSGERIAFNEVMSEKDLTSTAVRDTNGTLIYSPGEVLSMDPKQNYSDIVPVYTDKDIACAWLERPKDPVRGSPQVTGIDLYPPSVDSLSFPPLKKNKEWACYTTEGSYVLKYTAPVFNSEGVLTKAPTLSWAGGPARTLNWYTGLWSDLGTPYVYSYYNANPDMAGRFSLFGKSPSSTGSSFIIDNTGVHKYVVGIGNDGEEYAYTCRGFGVNPKVVVENLPYENKDYLYENPSVSTLVNAANEKLNSGKNTNLLVNMEGYLYIDEIVIDFQFGIGSVFGQDVRFDVPKVEVYINSLGTAILTASSDYDVSTTQVVYETSGEDGSIYSYDGSSYKNVRYTVGRFAQQVNIRFLSLTGGARAYIDSIKILYRKPVDRDETVYAYERKLNVSRADSGLPDYRDLLFYYSRVDPEIGDSLTTSYSNDSSYPSIKWVNRNVKDVVLEYEYVDITGTRFPYKEESKPINNPGVSVDSYDITSVTSNINICNKSRTLIAGSHVEDSPQTVSVGGEVRTNSLNVAVNETSTCASAAGNKKFDETLQKCLYSEASSLVNTYDTVYTWFWHPDEIDFWENTVHVSLSPFTKILTLSSTVAPLFRLWENEYFGCSAGLSTTYSDGRLHSIDKWQALGHRVYTGDPMFNDTCMQVVIFKIVEHVGEMYYGTSDYVEYTGDVTWPYMESRDRSFYIERGLVEKRTNYIGGAIGGAGIDFWVQQSQFAHGETLPQKIDEWETSEAVYGGRAGAAAATPVSTTT